MKVGNTERVFFCKGCRKLETVPASRPVNTFSCTDVVIDGVAYKALYLHARPDGKVVDFGGIPAIQMWSLGRR